MSQPTTSIKNIKKMTDCNGYKIDIGTLIDTGVKVTGTKENIIMKVITVNEIDVDNPFVLCIPLNNSVTDDKLTIKRYLHQIKKYISEEDKLDMLGL